VRLGLLVALAAAAPVAAQPADSVARHAARHEALERLLDDASRRNRLPPDLQTYRARVESEIAVLLRREEGNEAVAGIEQVASDLRWTRTGFTEQHVVGYRTQQVGPNVSLLSIAPTGWINPVLYGNRLRVGTRGGRTAREAAPRDTVQAVHPLATDRARYYAYAGGDTVAVLQAGARRIPIVQVRVLPRSDVPARTVLFDGELLLDASRGALVKLRGHFVEMGTRPSRLASALRGSVGDAIAFLEFEQGERNGAYWLPARQRVELQAMAPVLGDGRAVVRIVSRFMDMAVNDTAVAAVVAAAEAPAGNGPSPGADSAPPRRRTGRRLTYAAGDSIARFTGWRLGIGAQVAETHSDDFADIGPDRWRSTGPARLDWTAPRPADVFRYNRVEGAFTGVGLKWSLRDRAPGVVVRANAGYAWGEQAVRGRVSVERRRGPWSVEARGGRSLDITNDFRAPLDSGSSANALFGSVDAYDYVDRTSGTLALVHRLGGRTLVSRAEVGYADDRWRPATQARSPFGGAAFRENRGVDEGGYLRSALLLEWKPDVGAEYVRPGIGGRLAYERGDGTLAWQRVEARLSARRPLGPLVVTARADAGAVLGDRPPPQQLFELGERQNLPGYPDKAFAGTRAAAVRGQLLYLAPVWQQPIRLGQRFFIPGLSPGVSVGLQSGWADAPTAGAREALRRLGLVRDSAGAEVPVSVPTGRVRASATAGLRFFGSALFAGGTRPVDQAAPWRWLVSFGQPW
jgi:hypothetical protein